ncbi:MAG: histidine kinase [Lachnospiraceae bacterium]|nr:histidine kinase [Lachnospiraceae bacterium]
MLKNKSYLNGDTETSDLISQLAALFRGLINTKVFISVKEELAFANRYLTLMSARYGDCVESDYDIPSELLNYGIIRNVFQLLIENYFVHGFSADAEKTRRILLSGKSTDATHMIFCVTDNGTGLSAEDMQILNEKIQEPIRHGEKHYGLKNLNQRLKLFYGPDCGVKVLPGMDGGLCVQITMRKMTVEEYESTVEKGEAIL